MSQELQARLEERGHELEWADVIQDLDRLQMVEVEQDGKRFLLRAEAQGTCGKVFQAVGVALPPSASASVFGQRGASPLQARALRPVTDGNCVLARGGGKQPEVNDQPVTKVNSIRPDRAASLLGNGEARTGMTRKPATLRGSVSKRSRGRLGGWRRDGRTAEHMKQRDLPGSQRCSLSLIRIRRAAGQESERP